MREMQHQVGHQQAGISVHSLLDAASSQSETRCRQKQLGSGFGFPQGAPLLMSLTCWGGGASTPSTGTPIFVTALQDQQVEESPQPSTSAEKKIISLILENLVLLLLLLVFMEFTGRTNRLPQAPNCPCSPLLPVLATVHPLLSDSPPPLSLCTCFLGTK